MNLFYRQRIDEEHISQGRETHSYVAIFLSQGIMFFNNDPKLILLTWKSNPIFISPSTPTYHTYTHVHATFTHYTCTHLHTTPAHHTYRPHLQTTPAHHTYITHLHTTPTYYICTPHLHTYSMNSVLVWVKFFEVRKFPLAREWVSNRTTAAAAEIWGEGNPAFYIWWEDIMVSENPLADVPWGTYDSSMRSGMVRLGVQLQPWQQPASLRYFRWLFTTLLQCLDQPVALREDVFPETATELGFDIGLSIREMIEQEEGKDSLWPMHASA